MASLPPYLDEELDDLRILRRMLDRLPQDWDRSEGGVFWDLLSPVAVELAQAAMWAQEVLRRGFASTTFGPYLDLRAEEHGLTRRPAAKASGVVRFTGAPGTAIPLGTRVSTLSSEAAPAQVFETTVAATIGSEAAVEVPIVAIEPGAAGNVPAGAISVLASAIPGVTGVTNPSPTTGGADEEDDASLLQRLLWRMRNPSAGGNKADYLLWAMEVPGVGGASVIPVRDGPGTVAIAIIDTEKKPASQALVDAVQDYIAPPHRMVFEAEALTLGGFGVAVDDSLTDDVGSSVRMAYDAGGPGRIVHGVLHSVLPQPGTWTVRPRVKVSSNAGTVDLLEVGIWNISANAWAKISPSSQVDARRIWRAVDLGTAFGEIVQQFYWNGQDQLELRITRLQADTQTVVWVDQVGYRSTFSRDDGSGKAPIGARVTVEPAVAVVISISARLTIAPGYNPDSVRAAVRQALEDYIKSLAFAENNDVIYVRVGSTILDVPGVLEYSDLLVNGGTSNVPIGPQEVAVLGTVTLT